jgi:hypothetical protein
LGFFCIVREQTCPDRRDMVATIWFLMLYVDTYVIEAIVVKVINIKKL